MQKVVKKEITLGSNKLTLETGELANQANGSVLAQYGETVVLATAVAQEASSAVDYFPLSVEYEEKLYAGGKISSSRFIKRETRPTEEAVLTSRLIDRSIRPLFPKDYQAEVQVIITVLSVDGENDPGILALIAASAALAISDIPWNGPLSGLRIGLVNDGLVVNPTKSERALAKLLTIVATNRTDIAMIEAEGNEVEEKHITQAMELAVKEGNKVIDLIEDLTKEAGKAKATYTPQKADEATEKEIKEFIKKEIMKDFKGTASQDEGWFGDTMKVLEEEFVKEGAKATGKIIANVLEDEVADYLRNEILVNHTRPDGRKPDEIRELTAKVQILPRTHGSAIFQRGVTQVLSIATLGSSALEQLIESMDGEERRRFMHHYNFPPFSVGETRRRGAPGRREIGHGALAEKSIRPVMPASDDFPYTVRVVSEVLSSAGSTSQASVCATTLALMDAGVPIKAPVAGISIGLITDKKDKSKYVTITDIAYQEDAQGDMDFKVAGTKDGVTAIQMDTKLEGVPTKILVEALEKAKVARLKILEKMLSTIPKSRTEVSKHAPKVILIKIDPTKIGEVIGSGGRIINKIIAETGALIDITDEGNVTISSKDIEACQKAAQWVEGIVKLPEIGEEYEGPVRRILPFGAMVEILPGKEGLVHISKLAPQRVEKVEDVVKVGDIVKVRVAELDDQGRVNLSMLTKEQEDGRRGDSSENRGYNNDRNRSGGGDRDRRRGGRRF